jgi:hypothetical protein
LLYEAITNKKTTIGKFPLVVVHRQNIGVFDEKGCHVFFEGSIVEWLWAVTRND